MIILKPKNKLKKKRTLTIWTLIGTEWNWKNGTKLNGIKAAIANRKFRISNASQLNWFRHLKRKKRDEDRIHNGRIVTIIGRREWKQKNEQWMKRNTCMYHWMLLNKEEKNDCATLLWSCYYHYHHDHWTEDEHPLNTLNTQKNAFANHLVDYIDLKNTQTHTQTYVSKKSQNV